MSAFYAQGLSPKKEKGLNVDPVSITVVTGPHREALWRLVAGLPLWRGQRPQGGAVQRFSAAGTCGRRLGVPIATLTVTNGVVKRRGSASAMRSRERAAISISDPVAVSPFLPVVPQNDWGHPDGHNVTCQSPTTPPQSQ